MSKLETVLDWKEKGNAKLKDEEPRAN